MTVLLVDDDVHNQRIFETVLRHAGFIVRQASSGEEALREARTHLPDLILMDLSIPVIDGWECTRQLKADEATRNLLAGIELTYRELMQVFERYNIRRVDPLGERFDPHFHQAMFEVPDPEAPPGTVVQVVQPGYRIGERVLRPALVAVSKGGPKTPPASAAGSPEQASAESSSSQ